MRNTTLLPIVFSAFTSALGLHCVAMHGDVTQLRARAAYEFNCPAESLRLQPLGERTYGVDGCGRRATYVWAYQNESWLLDSAAPAPDRLASAGAAVAPPAADRATPPVGPPAPPSGTSAASPPRDGAATALAAAVPAAAPASLDPKACESMHDYKRRAGEASGAVRVQLQKIADRKEAECRAQGKAP